MTNHKKGMLYHVALKVGTTNGYTKIGDESHCEKSKDLAIPQPCPISKRQGLANHLMFPK